MQTAVRAAIGHERVTLVPQPAGWRLSFVGPVRFALDRAGLVEFERMRPYRSNSI
jgi:hypothetical protein